MEDVIQSKGYYMPDRDSPVKTGHGDLASSLVTRGQISLLKGNLPEGLKCFDEALKLESANAQLYYIQGLSLFEYGEKNKRAKILTLANKKFKKAIALDPQNGSIWQAWGSALFALGESYGEMHYFQEAKEKIAHAVQLSQGFSADALSDLHWEWGAICLSLAEFSEEALDVHQAIAAFQKALSFDRQLPPEFWADYGKACYRFAQHINETRFYTKALYCLKHALATDPSSCGNWELLAHIYCSLYQHTYDEDFFAQAGEAYASATRLEPNNPSLWLQWATFLCESARKSIDLKCAHACLEKSQRAWECDPENPQVLAIWAEALALIGCETEKLDLLYEAQNKIAEAVDAAENLPAIWFSYGMILKAFAKYFHDQDYYYQAIEKFQEGLSIDRTCHAHWHAIGQLYAFLGEFTHDAANLERSLKFYQKAIHLHPAASYAIDSAIALYKLGEITRDQQRLEWAVAQFERVLHAQRSMFCSHSKWLYYYACTLDALGDFHEEEAYYQRAIEILSQVLMIDPEFHCAHHRLGLALAHSGELTDDLDLFHRAIQHFRICAKRDEDNDCIALDWGTTLINIACRHTDPSESEHLFRQAEQKLWTAIRLGNPHGYYHLACLYSLLTQCEKAMLCLHKAARFDILPPIDEMLQDEWLDNLRPISNFIEFLSQLEQRDNSASE
ncbi:MAG TPA: hypothetical protein VGJ00_07555 [Rhabdochlamydiaceae bacterium]|jgi:tetratricopeptide (TPR) repeat protein